MLGIVEQTADAQRDLVDAVAVQVTGGQGDGERSHDVVIVFSPQLFGEEDPGVHGVRVVGGIRVSLCVLAGVVEDQELRLPFGRIAQAEAHDRLVALVAVDIAGGHVDGIAIAPQAFALGDVTAALGGHAAAQPEGRQRCAVAAEHHRLQVSRLVLEDDDDLIIIAVAVQVARGHRNVVDVTAVVGGVGPFAVEGVGRLGNTAAAVAVQHTHVDVIGVVAERDHNLIVAVGAVEIAGRHVQVGDVVAFPHGIAVVPVPRRAGFIRDRPDPFVVVPEDGNVLVLAVAVQIAPCDRRPGNILQGDEHGSIGSVLVDQVAPAGVPVDVGQRLVFIGVIDDGNLILADEHGLLAGNGMITVDRGCSIRRGGRSRLFRWKRRQGSGMRSIRAQHETQQQERQEYGCGRKLRKVNRTTGEGSLLTTEFSDRLQNRPHDW